jgi:hypothetical protein
MALANVRVGAPARVIGVSPRGVSGSQLTLANWTGYVDDNSLGFTYNKVSGHWVQPAVTCIRKNDQELAVFWVGIDGYNSTTVEQDGTLALCNNGVVSYYDWWEMVPTNSIQIVSPILPGDTMASSVTFLSGAYTLKVTDATHPVSSFTTTQTCSVTCTDASAEWIAERPSIPGGFAVLPDFRTWKLTHASVTSYKKGAIKTFPYDDAIMENSSAQVLAFPSAPNSTGTGFKAFWRQSA